MHCFKVNFDGGVAVNEDEASKVAANLLPPAAVEASMPAYLERHL